MSREPTAQELDALKEILLRALPASDEEEMTARALACAKAVKAAFDEAYAA